MSRVDFKIGRYRGVPVEEGGFAAVYRVVDDAGHPYALKLVHSDVDQATQGSLRHEFRVQSELVHPQVVQAHDIGLHERRPYVVLDWVDGAPFWEPFTTSARADDFTRVLSGLASVLSFIHHRGWVHGDLKPDNLIWRLPSSARVSTSPLLCLLDFGLARPVGDLGRPRGAGTIGYCAPEFLDTQAADGRADWYSAGVILYEWVFGVRPYAADEPADEIAGHLEGRADFTRNRLRPTPPWADDVIARLLAKDPNGRGTTELALLEWLASFDPSFTPQTLLNQQLGWHVRSEALRLRSVDEELLECLEKDLEYGLSANWSMSSHAAILHPWLKQAECVCVLHGCDVQTTKTGAGVFVLQDVEHRAETGLRVCIHAAPRLALDFPCTEEHDLRALCLLTWDHAELKAYLSAIIGEVTTADAWADLLLHATCGLPAAVNALLSHLADTGALRVDADGWHLDEDVVTRWRDTNIQTCIQDVLGALSPPERMLCEWLAIGESFGSTEVLSRVSGFTQDELAEHIERLVGGGVVSQTSVQLPCSFDLKLRMFGHDAVLRASIDSGTCEIRAERLGQAVEECSPTPETTRVEVLAHTFNRALLFDRASDYALRTASIAIKGEDRERAMRYINLAKESAERIAEPNGRAHWMGHARMVEGDLQKAVGQLDAARQTYRALLALCRKTGDRRLLAETLHDLGDLYRIMRRYDKGIRVEQYARRLWETLGDRGQLSRSLNSLGNLHRVASDLPRALEFYNQALVIQKELGLEQYAATNLNNIGVLHHLQYEFVQADAYYREALAIQERLSVPVEIARVINNLGANSFVQGKLPESEGYFARAAAVNAEAGAQAEELFNRWNIVEVALESGDLRKCVTLGEQVYKACGQIGELSTAAEVAALLADAYFRAGDDRRYRSFHDLCHQTAACLTNDDLQIHLRLQQAARDCRFGQHARALSILDSITPADRPIANRYRYLDALILRACIASTLGDTDTLAHIWRLGAPQAETISAPHKKAQLAWAIFSGTRVCSHEDEHVRCALQFIAVTPCWHWFSAFKLWRARNHLARREYEVAMSLATDAVDRLRQDGNWETLWRALVLLGEVYHALADYEPSLRACEEAERVLKVVASTVDDPTERAAYVECEETRVLQRVKDRITQLVS